MLDNAAEAIEQLSERLDEQLPDERAIPGQCWKMDGPVADGSDGGVAEMLLHGFSVEGGSELWAQQRAPAAVGMHLSAKPRSRSLESIHEDKPLDDKVPAAVASCESNGNGCGSGPGRAVVGTSSDASQGAEAGEWQGWASQVNDLLNDFHHKLAKLEWRVDHLSELCLQKALQGQHLRLQQAPQCQPTPQSQQGTLQSGDSEQTSMLQARQTLQSSAVYRNEDDLLGRQVPNGQLGLQQQSVLPTTYCEVLQDQQAPSISNIASIPAYPEKQLATEQFHAEEPRIPQWVPLENNLQAGPQSNHEREAIDNAFEAVLIGKMADADTLQKVRTPPTSSLVAAPLASRNDAMFSCAMLPSDGAPLPVEEDRSSGCSDITVGVQCDPNGVSSPSVASEHVTSTSNCFAVPAENLPTEQVFLVAMKNVAHGLQLDDGISPAGTPRSSSSLPSMAHNGPTWRWAGSGTRASQLLQMGISTTSLELEAAARELPRPKAVEQPQLSPADALKRLNSFLEQSVSKSRTRGQAAMPATRASENSSQL